MMTVIQAHTHLESINIYLRGGKRGHESKLRMQMYEN